MDSASTTTTTTATRIMDPKPNSAVEHNHSRQDNDNPSSSSSSVDPITVVFSDVDGTLVHYPTKPVETTLAHDNNGWLALPASRTGLRGYLSARTLQLCQTLRNDGKVKLVIVSGMRTSTLMQRLPYLPRAHAYCSESGGRIFYVPNEETETDELRLQPPFVLVEDVEWKRCMQAVVGTTRYRGNQVHDYYHTPQGGSSTGDSPSSRTPSNVPNETQDTGDNNNNNNNNKDDTTMVLWKYAQTLETQHGLVLDTKGYSTCFRINRKQQPTVQAQQAFDALLDAMVPPADNDNERTTPVQSLSRLEVPLPPSSLSYSTNLGCIDVYPNRSGKRNCCHYLMQQFMGRSTTRAIQNNDNPDDNDKDDDSELFLLNRHAICLCDDDNDLEMAWACRHAILPQLTSDRIARVAATHPHHFLVTAPPPNHNDNNDTTPTESSLAAHLQATERALECALERVAQSHGAAAPSSSSLHP